MKHSFSLALLLAVSLTAGCTISHPVADDYHQYIENNSDETVLPKADLESDYLIDENTVNHRYEFRSATAGYANLWIVEFGKMLDETLKSQYVQTAFDRLSKVKQDDKNDGELMVFKLNNYEFKEHMAHISMNISMVKNGQVIFSKNYSSQGNSQGGKMFWGGVFAMKNATQQSTKYALDQILTDFIHDANSDFVTVDN